MSDFNQDEASPRLNLLVLRSPDAKRLMDFYSRLGLIFSRHRHGAGPEHFAAEMGSGVLEIYPLESPTSAKTTGVRLGFAVANVDKSYAELVAAGGTEVRHPSNSAWGRRAVVRDLAGHKVELTESRNEVAFDVQTAVASRRKMRVVA